MCACVCVSMCACMCVCVCVSVCDCVCVRLCVCTHACMYLLSLDVLAVEVASLHESLAQGTQLCDGVSKVLNVQIQRIQLLQHSLQKQRAQMTVVPELWQGVGLSFRFECLLTSVK